jgi:hypothetical protein
LIARDDDAIQFQQGRLRLDAEMRGDDRRGFREPDLLLR